MNCFRLDREPRENLVGTDLEDWEITPRMILVGLRKREREFTDSRLDGGSLHGPIVAVSVLCRPGTRKTSKP
jgi:hypothetical protein